MSPGMGSRGEPSILILLDTDHVTVLLCPEDKRHMILVAALQLLSANLKDFEKVPGLRVENWLE